MSYTMVDEQEWIWSANPWKGDQSVTMARWLDQSMADEPWAAVRVTSPARQQSWNYNGCTGFSGGTDKTSMKAEDGSAKGK